jgi:phenol 2-monooxygenase
VFESFGIAEELLREAYHVLEVTFWGNSEAGIHRTRRTPDTIPGLSHQPHVILNQARINGLLLEAMRRFNDQGVDYGYTVKSVEVKSQGADPYPVTVIAEKDGKEVECQAKYVLVHLP